MLVPFVTSFALLSHHVPVKAPVIFQPCCVSVNSKFMLMSLEEIAAVIIALDEARSV
jgi:hypothetical protein